jgi:hypothetical protein
MKSNNKIENIFTSSVDAINFSYKKKWPKYVIYQIRNN